MKNPIIRFINLVCCLILVMIILILSPVLLIIKLLWEHIAFGKDNKVDFRRLDERQPKILP